MKDWVGRERGLGLLSSQVIRYICQLCDSCGLSWVILSGWTLLLLLLLTDSGGLEALEAGVDSERGCPTHQRWEHLQSRKDRIYKLIKVHVRDSYFPATGVNLFHYSIQCCELSGNTCEPSACFTLLLFTEHDLIDTSCFYTWPMENAGRISSELSEGFSFSHVSRRRGWFVSDVFSLLEARWFGLAEGAAWVTEDDDEHSPAVNSLDNF